MHNIAILFSEDGRRWMGLVKPEDLERARLLGATREGEAEKLKLESLTLTEIFAEDFPPARVFDAELRKREARAKVFL